MWRMWHVTVMEMVRQLRRDIAQCVTSILNLHKNQPKNTHLVNFVPSKNLGKIAFENIVLS